jgi:hypothetical protein
LINFIQEILFTGGPLIPANGVSDCCLTPTQQFLSYIMAQ